MRKFVCFYNTDVDLFNDVVEEKGGKCDWEKDNQEELFGMSPNQVKQHFHRRGEEVEATKEDFS